VSPSIRDYLPLIDWLMECDVAEGLEGTQLHEWLIVELLHEVIISLFELKRDTPIIKTHHFQCAVAGVVTLPEYGNHFLGYGIRLGSQYGLYLIYGQWSTR